MHAGIDAADNVAFASAIVVLLRRRAVLVAGVMLFLRQPVCDGVLRYGRGALSGTSRWGGVFGGLGDAVCCLPLLA